jgi:transposase InsO family protein
MKFQFIESHKKTHAVQTLCQMFQVTPSGYYQWKGRGKSNREKENDFLLEKIKETYEKNRCVYGSPRITQALHREAIICSQPRVARLMRANGIVAKTQRKFKATTNSNHTLPVAADLVGQAFGVDGPNKLWVGDITYIDTDEGWLYLSKVMDAYNREIIGWAVNKRMTKDLVIKAMDRAIRKRRPTESPIFHSDRGSQYASYAFRRLLVNNHIRQSMSGKGNCYDNAMAESFFKTLKTELIYQNKYQTRQEAKQDIFEYIEVFYNRQRLHSALGYKTPIEYGKLQDVA